MMTRRIVVSALIVLTVMSGHLGCLSLSKEAPIKRRYGLTARRSTLANDPIAAVLLVRDVAASSWYDGRGLVYRTGELTFDRDFYHEFFASPSTILSSEIRRWFQGSGLFKSVVTAGSYVDPDFFLEGEIVGLHGDYSETVGRAVVALNLLFLRQGDGRPELVFQREFRAEKLLVDDEVDTLVLGLQAALEEIFSDVEGTVRSALEHEVPSPTPVDSR